MSYRETLRILSSYLYFLAAILCIPLLLAAYYQFRIEWGTHPQVHTTSAFAYTLVICLSLAWLCKKGAGKAQAAVYRQREAIGAVVLIWFLSPAIGALPFVLSGTLERFDQAYFEATSGFTTTGATLLNARQDNQSMSILCMGRGAVSCYATIQPVEDDLNGTLLEGLEAISPALLFWRSFMQWLGGMGMIVLFVAFLPELGVKGKFLFQAETPGLIKEGFKPRIKETALQLWKIYVGLTLLEILFLMVVDRNMPLFDAITLAFSTLSTGGFSVHNDNMAYYQKPVIQWVILGFMLLGSLNFSLYYAILKGKFYRLFDTELIGFLMILLLLGCFTTWQLKGTPIVSLTGELTGVYSSQEALRVGFFQLIAMQTSTGFFVANYDTWPYIIQLVLLIAMYLGGMSGSTTGGMKVIRLQILFQVLKTKIKSISQPTTVTVTRIGKKEIDSTTALSVLCFFFVVMATSALGTFFYVWDGIDLGTSLSLTAGMINNTGMGFRMAGPASTMAFLSPFACYLSSFLMILGRLEFFVVLAVLFPTFWKEH